MGNAGGVRLNWVADTKGAIWLKLLSPSGAIEPGALRQSLYVAADTTHLKAGSYVSTLRISSSGGEAQLSVKMTVIPPGQQQARLATSPSSLDFGTLTTGTQVALQAAISNLGTQSLNWRVDIGKANWLTVSRNAGTVQPGGLPRTIYITKVRRSSLRDPTRRHSNSIRMGAATLATTLVVISPPPGSSPTQASKNVPAPPLTVSPGSFNGNKDCSYARGQGWICVATLSNAKNAQRPLDWAASGSGVSGITFFPAKGSVLPGQVALVNALLPDTLCPASATLTFTGPANTVRVPWLCTPLPADLLVAPFSFTANTDCTFTSGQGWVCPATLISLGVQSGLNWKATGSAISGITLNPAKGTLPPGSSMPVIIIVPGTNCPAAASITFSGPANSVAVPWSCSPPQLVVSPGNFSDGCLSCTVTLTPAPGSQGNLKWSASSSGIPGITFSPVSGTLSSGQSAQVAVSVPNTNCPASATITFTGTANVVPVSWTCSPGRVIVDPDTFIAGANRPSADNGWLCTALLSPSSDSQGVFAWSASSNISGVTFNPSSGTVSPGRNVPVTIFIPSSDCQGEVFQFHRTEEHCHSDMELFDSKGRCHAHEHRLSSHC